MLTTILIQRKVRLQPELFIIMLIQSLPIPETLLDKKQLLVLDRIKLFAKEIGKSNSLFNFFADRTAQNSGIYLYGSVGTGKTILMQHFFQMLGPKKLMLHYQNLMQSVHQDIHSLRSTTESTNQSIKKIAANYAKKVKVICIDEFEIKDITDAMIVGPLLLELIKCNIFIFITSNTKPEDLYKDGLQRSSFLPVIKEIYDKFEVIYLDNQHDYRLDKVLQLSRRIIYPINEETKPEIQKIVTELSSDNKLLPIEIEVFGRKIPFKMASNSTLVTDFNELFVRELGYADYVNLCQKFTVIMVENVDIIDPANSDIAVRFINFIDNAYFYKVILFMTLKEEPMKIYQNGLRNDEFKRTISRLHEMNSQSYVQR